jgi:RNA polymerase sigma-70 factor (ECF subfamily)
MLLVAKGQPQQLATLFGRHHRKLYNFFRKLGNPQHSSEDLVQETFMRMLRYAGSYKETGQFVAWMYQIARNAGADSYRNMHCEDIADEAVLAEIPAHTQEDPELLQGEFETGQQLQRALLRLPQEKRELVLLGRVRELRSEDLAQSFGCSPAVIKVRLHRCLLLLREYFEEERQGTNNHKRQSS